MATLVAEGALPLTGHTLSNSYYLAGVSVGDDVFLQFFHASNLAGSGALIVARAVSFAGGVPTVLAESTAPSPGFTGFNYAFFGNTVAPLTDTKILFVTAPNSQGRFGIVAEYTGGAISWGSWALVAGTSGSSNDINVSDIINPYPTATLYEAFGEQVAMVALSASTAMLLITAEAQNGGGLDTYLSLARVLTVSGTAITAGPWYRLTTALPRQDPVTFSTNKRFLSAHTDLGDGKALFTERDNSTTFAAVRYRVLSVAGTMITEVATGALPNLAGLAAGQGGKAALVGNFTNVQVVSSDGTLTDTGLALADTGDGSRPEIAFDFYSRPSNGGLVTTSYTYGGSTQKFAVVDFAGTPAVSESWDWTPPEPLDGYEAVPVGNYVAVPWVNSDYDTRGVTWFVRTPAYPLAISDRGRRARFKGVF